MACLPAVQFGDRQRRGAGRVNKPSVFVDVFGMTDARRRFITAINNDAPPVCADLRDSVLGFYRENLHVLEAGDRRITPDTLTAGAALREALDVWGRKHNLTYRGMLPSWLYESARATLSLRARDGARSNCSSRGSTIPV